MDPALPLELAVLAVRGSTVRCFILGTRREITLRSPDHWKAVPGEIARVRPHKVWSYARHPYVSGTIEATRLDVAALRLTPLKLEPFGLWDPEAYEWGDEDWESAIQARDPWPCYEMEQVLPGTDPADPDDDPILEAVETRDPDILMDLLEADLRCLDAHAHLGNFMFDLPHVAVRHYEAGLRIGELSLGPSFDGILSWGMVDNRPFLRCLHGYGLCLWRLARFDEAAGVFERMLRLNPCDNQGARFLIDDVRDRREWKAEPVAVQ